MGGPRNKPSAISSWPLALALLSGAASALAAPAPAGRDLLMQKCGECHAEGDKLARIHNIRKTPEGWDMTLVRMGQWHNVKLSADERRALVKYLSDTQGLAPEEVTAFRFITERRPNSTDNPPDEELAQMCARCHSFGRVGLQRRDEAEWRKLMHTHLGQFPGLEYSFLGRDRNWWEIARDKLPAKLAAAYPFKTEAWQKWSKRTPASAAGTWRVAGERPGTGTYVGTMQVKPTAARDEYKVSYDLRYAGGKRVKGEGKATLFTGFDWRGSAKLGDEHTRSIYALSEDGSRMSGRWFLKDADEQGADFQAVRVRKGTTAVLSVEPRLIRAGETASVTIEGVNLAGPVVLGQGLEVVGPVQRTPERVTLKVRAPAAAAGLHRVQVGTASLADGLAVYDRIDSLRVEPAFALARVGGGGARPPVAAQFQAVAFLNGPDGKPGTADDVRLGALPAQWAADNFNDAAKDMEDAKFAGAIDQNGLFRPGVAGPNAKRRFGTNNTGDLAVTATVKDGERTLQASSRLVVTVQRFNNPPLR